MSISEGWLFAALYDMLIAIRRLELKFGPLLCRTLLWKKTASPEKIVNRTE